MKTIENLTDGFWDLAQLALPFLMPLFNMMLVVDAVQRHLHVKLWVAWVLGVGLELLGGTVLHLLMQVQGWNRMVANPPRNRSSEYKTAGKISLWYELGIWCVFAMYVLMSLVLVLIFDIAPGYAKYAPAVVVPLIACVYFLNATGMELRRLRAVVDAERVGNVPVRPTLPASPANSQLIPALAKPADSIANFIPQQSANEGWGMDGGHGKHKNTEQVYAGLPARFMRVDVEQASGLAKTAAVDLIRQWIGAGNVGMGSKRGEYVKL